MSGDLPVLQKIQRLAWYMKTFSHSAREHDNSGAVIQEFLHIGNLNSGIMTSPGLAPVPITRATRKKLCVLVRFSFSFNLEPAPGNMFDQGRRISILHNKNSQL